MVWYSAFRSIALSLAASLLALSANAVTQSPVPPARPSHIRVLDQSLVSGRARVIDGDTLEIRGERLRIHGIDAPERSDRCQTAHGQSWRCGIWAGEQLAQLIGTSALTCHDLGERTHERRVVRCSLGGRDLASELLQRGIVRACARYAANYPHSQGYPALEAAATRAARGIFAGQAPERAEFCLPQAERRERQAALASVEGECLIKGNISESGRIYHRPGQRDYARVSINIDAGERWFCSEAEARAAGWRAAQR